MEFEIDFASDSLENEYFDLVDHLDVKMSAAIYRDLERFELGILPKKLIKSLGNGLCELITSFSHNEFRTLFIYQPGAIIIVSHGFIKKTQKTPHSEITRAQRNIKRYLERKG